MLLERLGVRHPLHVHLEGFGLRVAVHLFGTMVPVEEASRQVVHRHGIVAEQAAEAIADAREQV